MWLICAMLVEFALCIVLRATSVEMVTTLTHSQHGRQYLAQQGIIDKISNMIIGAESDPLSGLYLPGNIFLRYNVMNIHEARWFNMGNDALLIEDLFMEYYSTH